MNRKQTLSIMINEEDHLRMQSIRSGLQLTNAFKLIDRVDSALEERLNSILHGIPNLPHETVSVGSDETANAEVRRWGTAPSFDFAPLDHVDLGMALGILDMDRAAKIAGARFSLLCGAGALMERALINFMLDVHVTQHGYTEVMPPFVANSASLFGTGKLPKFATDLFRLEGTDFYLIPTAEVPVTNIYQNEASAPMRASVASGLASSPRASTA